MAFMLIHFDAPYNEWKPIFDSDPAGRAEVAKGYIVLRGVDNPNDIFVRVEFASVDEARAFREKLISTGVLGGYLVKTGPTVVEIVDQHTY